MSTPSSRGGTSPTVAAAAVIAALLALVYWQQVRLASAFAADQLATSRAAQALIETRYRDDLHTRAQLIAGNQAFVGYVAQALGGALPGIPVDTSSIVDLLEERREQLGLAVAAVLDGQGRLVVATEQFNERTQSGQERLFLRARDTNATASAVWADGERLLHVAVLPLAPDGSSDGYLLVGTPLDRVMARELAGVGGVDVAMLATTGSGRRIVASSLSPSDEIALAASLPTGGVALAPGPLRLSGRGLAEVSPLFGGPAGQLVMAAAPRGLAATSWLLLPSLLVVAAVVLLMLWARAAWSREVKRPAGVLADLIDRAAQGDFVLKAPDRDTGALSGVAASFNRLMARLQSR